MKRPVRFSLLTLFFVTTIVALALAFFLARSRLHEVQAESDRLKNEFGELSISDNSQVHVISVPTAEAMNWRWRVYLPGGHDFGLYVYRGEMDAAGRPLTNSLAIKGRIGGQTSPLEPREIVIDLALGKTAEGASCLWISENGRAGSPVTFGSSLPTWASGSKMLSERIAGERKTVSAASTVPLGLVSLNGVDAAGTSSDDAVLVWIGQYEKAPTQSLRGRGIVP